VELKDRLTALVRALPPAQRVGIVVGVAVLLMAAVPFLRWVTSPSYGVLYAGVADAELATVLGELDTLGVPYELDGSRIMVPQDKLHTVRANLAQAGVSSTPTVPGYELLDAQALGTSDLRQRVDLQRAVEGELARTLGAMDAIDTATVRLVLPEDQLFTENEEPTTASVLVRPARQLDAGEIEAITLLVSSAVEGLTPDQITVADTAGRVLHAPGDGSTGGVTDRQQRRTQEFERRMATELSALLERATNAPASVVVRADLDFDEVETQTDTYDPEGTGGVALREAESGELYEGTGAPVGGTVGVDGGPLANAGIGEGTYERDEATREFGVDRVTTRVVRAPGSVEGLSVALVVDEASPVPDGDLRELITAAAGLDAERGDAVAISRVTIPEAEEIPEADAGMMDLIRQVVALLVLVVVAVGLFLMSRARRRDTAEPEKVVAATVRPAPALADAPAAEAIPTGPTIQDEVSQLVERQPEEIAALLRGWLADRRTVAR
jgi:flagellar M-ring protein FliF